MTERAEDSTRGSHEYIIAKDERCPRCGNAKWRLTPGADNVAICPDCEYATNDPFEYHEQ